MRASDRLEILKRKPVSELHEQLDRLCKGVFKVYEVMCLKGGGPIARPALSRFVEEANRRLA